METIEEVGEEVIGGWERIEEAGEEVVEGWEGTGTG